MPAIGPAASTLLLTALLVAPTHATGDGAETEAVTNRLADSASPYLRQHAHNPIDWYPWGEEAFERAQRENKPIFLSVGYSTCHWCHVMARESFEDPVVGELLNRHFIAVKVDRERRPEVDEPYLLATQTLTGRGGWPNNMFLTPDLDPFFATVYEPRDALLALLQRGSELWRDAEAGLRRDGERVMAHVLDLMNSRHAAQTLDAEVLDATVRQLLARHDTFEGGFDIAPKFPRESWLLLLLHRVERDGDTDALRAIRTTVDNILDGGIHDQLQGGFHRYAVDPSWRVPHFEKMLYTQAQMARVLVKLHQLTGDPRYRDATRRTLDFVLTDMRDPDGGFYSAFDAEDAAGEGRFYTWTVSDLATALPRAADRELAAAYYGVVGDGPHHGQHVLHRARAVEALAADRDETVAETAFALRQATLQMRRVRAQRPAPKRDNKRVLDWNALVVLALAEAAQSLDNPIYLEAAQAALAFVDTAMVDANGALRRVYFDGRADLPAQQRDYALLARAHLAVHDATGDARWLRSAEAYAAEMHRRFHDAEAGDYFMNPSDDPMPRFKSRDDSAFPSGNGSALALYVELAQRTLDPDHRNRATSLMAALSGLVVDRPAVASVALVAADRMQRGHHGPRQHLSQGRVFASAQHVTGATRLSLRIEPGWHINAVEPLQDYLTATEVTLLDADGTALAQQPAVSLPPPTRKKLDYSPTELLLHDGEVQVDVPTAGAHAIGLTLQACSNDVCLPPTTAQFRLPVQP